MCYYNWPAEDTALQVPLEPDAATLDVARADSEIRLALPALPQANTAEGQHYLRPTLSNPRRPANTASGQHFLTPRHHPEFSRCFRAKQKHCRISASAKKDR